MAGQNLMPKSYDIRANRIDYNIIKSKLDSIRNDNRIAVKNTPEHASYLQEYGASIVK